MLQISETLQVIILAVIQGVAEFLPISSSGHLVVVDALFGNSKESAELNIVLHFGTLLAILIFFRRQIRELLTEDRRVIPLLLVGTIPVVIIGLWLKTNHEWILSNALLAGFMLPISGFILMIWSVLMPGRCPKCGMALEPQSPIQPSAKTIYACPMHPKIEKKGPGTKDYTDLTFISVMLIGCAQAFALLPGVSRSGATIVMGSLLGLKPQSAATFSFLLAIPAIAGASILEAKDILEEGAETPIWLLGLGAAIAFGVGLLALRWLVGWIEKRRLHWFAYWLIPLGFTVVVWQLYEIAKANFAG